MKKNNNHWFPLSSLIFKCFLFNGVAISLYIFVYRQEPLEKEQMRLFPCCMTTLHAIPMERLSCRSMPTTAEAKIRTMLSSNISAGDVWWAWILPSAMPSWWLDIPDLLLTGLLVSSSQPTGTSVCLDVLLNLSIKWIIKFIDC